jgi:hypothetical protein
VREKTHFRAENKSQKIMLTPGCYLLIMPAGKNPYIYNLENIFIHSNHTPLTIWKIVVAKTEHQ